MQDPIAKIQIRAVSPTKQASKVTLGVTSPKISPNGPYEVSVFLPNDQTPRPIYGEDSLQALCLALRFLSSRVSDLKNSGWKFEYLDGSGEIPFDAYLMPASSRSN